METPLDPPLPMAVVGEGLTSSQLCLRCSKVNECKCTKYALWQDWVAQTANITDVPPKREAMNRTEEKKECNGEIAGLSNNPRVSWIQCSGLLIMEGGRERYNIHITICE